MTKTKAGVIFAKVTKGEYKDSQLEIFIAGKATDCKVKCNGKLLHGVTQVDIRLSVGQPTTVTVRTIEVKR